MKTEFIPYEEALALKELGFNEPCLRVANPHGHTMWKWIEVDGDPPTVSIDDVVQVPYGEDWTQIPTFSQAFRFLREKYGLYSFIFCFNEGFGYETYKEGVTQTNESFETYEEAELECLKKLIQIEKK